MRSVQTRTRIIPVPVVSQTFPSQFLSFPPAFLLLIIFKHTYFLPRHLLSSIESFIRTKLYLASITSLRREIIVANITQG